jgi:hypothetical protein
VLHFTFIPNGQTSDQLSAMYEHIKAILKSSIEEQRFSWSEKLPNRAQMRTRDNRTPLVVAICHPEITKEIIRDLLNDMRDNSADSSNQTLPEGNVYLTQIFIAIEQVARQKRLKKYDCLTPVLEVCYPYIFNQLFHFSLPIQQC